MFRGRSDGGGLKAVPKPQKEAKNPDCLSVSVVTNKTWLWRVTHASTNKKLLHSKLTFASQDVMVMVVVVVYFETFMKTSIS